MPGRQHSQQRTHGTERGTHERQLLCPHPNKSTQTGEALELGSSDRTLASNMHGSHWTATQA